MKYSMTTPCDACPFLDTPQMKRGFKLSRLKSVHCAGALIFNEKRGYANQMMRICERLEFYDASKLNMEAKVR